VRKLILRNFQSPGDVVMLTAAVRDLHRAYPGQFLTDVRTSAHPLWAHNPYLTQICDSDPGATTIDCQYPLIHQSNHRPVHFIHGFIEDLSQQLGLNIYPTAFKGDIHLAPEEKRWMSQVQEITREVLPFWIVVAGGKTDFTIKWWDATRWQQVVDHFRGRILFVQVGEARHIHPPLEGVLDLRGRTNLRQLVRLVYHAQGVVCPVTLLMHLAAAVDVKGGRPKNRPCVVVAGGREPAQWEAYPHHQFIHRNGALHCCDNGGCWKSRTVPLGDDDQKDEKLCLDVVDLVTGQRQSGKDWGQGHGGTSRRLLPRCLDLISTEEVIRRIETYFDGGTARFLSASEGAVAARAITDHAVSAGRARENSMD
jgi:ADP-heptose:LPS heptosyltransferase